MSCRGCHGFNRGGSLSNVREVEYNVYELVGWSVWRTDRYPVYLLIFNLWPEVHIYK